MTLVTFHKKENVIPFKCDCITAVITIQYFYPRYKSISIREYKENSSFITESPLNCPNFKTNQ